MKATLSVIALVVIDQITKWATEAFLPWQQDVDLLPVLALFRTYNTGVAFSMFSDAGPLALAGLTCIIIVFIGWLWHRTPSERRLSHVGFALIISGAVGNLIDRGLHGYVIDMIRFHTDTWSFAVFNVADSYISIGAAAIVLDEVLSMRNQRSNAKGSDDA